MDLINLYAHEVGRRLPEDQRSDIEKEIRTLVEDTLEDEGRKTGSPVDEAITVEVLKRLGPPEKMAAAYLPPRYLIGPELYPHFLRTLRGVLALVALVAAILQGLAVGAASSAPLSVGDVITRVVGGIFNAMFIAAGIVVIVFAVMQYAGAARLSQADDHWDPLSLRQEPDARQVSITGQVIVIVANTLLLAALNFYPQWLGISALQDGVWVHAPVMSAAFFGYLPWLSALLVLGIVLHGWLLVKGRWTSGAIWAGVTLDLLTVVIAALLLSEPSLIALDASALQRLGWNILPESVSELRRGLEIAARLVLGLTIALQLIDAGKLALLYFRGHLPEPLTVSE